MKRKSQKSKTIKRRNIVIGSVAAGAAVGLIGFGIYTLVGYVQTLSRATFVTPYKQTVKDAFQDTDEPSVKVNSTILNGEEGYVVNKGPIRVRSAYRTLFDKQDLIEMAEWLYKNVSWGANGLSLTEMNFTTGIERKSGGIVLGSHTSARSGSNVYMSPDAFEQNRFMTGRVFNQFASNEPANAAPGNFLDLANKFLASSPILNNVSEELNNYFETSFKSNVEATPTQTKSYSKLTSEQIANVFSELFYDTNNDNFFTSQNLTNASANGVLASRTQWAQLLNNTYLGDNKISDVVRRLKAVETGTEDALLQSSLSLRGPIVQAWKLVQQATGATGQANEYLRLYLPEIISEENGVALDDRTEQRSVVSDTLWAQKWQQLRERLLGTSDANDSSSVVQEREAKVNEIEKVYQLFKTYYDLAKATLNLPAVAPIVSTIKNYLFDPSRLFAGAFTIMRRSTYNASDRARLFLDGSFSKAIETNVLRDDEKLYKSAEWKTLLATEVANRRISLQNSAALNAYVNKEVDFMSKTKSLTTLSKFYKKSMINTMRYTISHEYGHHETMWQANGVYDQTYKTQDPDTAATSLTGANKKLLDRFFSLGKNSQAFKSLSSNIQIANDQYSGTFSPSYLSYSNYRYKAAEPLDPASKGGWEGTTENQQASLYTGNTTLKDATTRLRPWYGAGRDSFLFGRTGLFGEGSYLYKLSDQFYQNLAIFGVTKQTFSSNFKIAWPAVSLLHEYQVAKWRLEFEEADRVAAAAGLETGVAQREFEAKHKIKLPVFVDKETRDYLYDRGPSGALSTLDGTPLQSITVLISALLRRILPAGSANVWDRAILATLIYQDIDRSLATLYDKLIKKYPNLFLPTEDKEAIDDYTRSLIVSDELYQQTVEALKLQNSPNPSADAFAPGIYLNPDNDTFKHYRPLLNSEKDFKENLAEGPLSTSGIAEAGNVLEANSDYTGSYAEFLTRAWNQLTFRPELSESLNSDGTLNRQALLEDNNGWFEDTTNLRAHGLNIYNFDPNNGDDTFITDDGAKLLMWYRELLGLHSNLDWSKEIPHDANGKVDLDALDASLDYATTFEKVYRYQRSGEFSMWGWLTKAEAARFKYIVIRSENGDKYIPISTKNTSNYFYYTDLTQKNRRSMTPGYVQWAAEWFVAGNYANAALSTGTNNEIFFAESLGGEPISIARTIDQEKVTLRNNDYDTDLAEVLLTADPKSNRVTVEVRSSAT